MPVITVITQLLLQLLVCSEFHSKESAVYFLVEGNHSVGVLRGTLWKHWIANNFEHPAGTNASVDSGGQAHTIKFSRDNYREISVLRRPNFPSAPCVAFTVEHALTIRRPKSEVLTIDITTQSIDNMTILQVNIGRAIFTAINW